MSDTQKVDVTFANGFMVGRCVAIDESEGFDVPCPGVDVRIRCEAIVTYTYGAPHCLLVSFGEEEESIQVWGTMEAMDAVMARDRMQEVASSLTEVPAVGPDVTPRVAGLKIVPWVDPDKHA